MSSIMSAEYVKSLNDLQLTVVINNTGSTVALDEFHRRYGWVEFAEASDRFVKDRTIAEAKDEYAALLKLTTKTRHKACLRFLFEAFQKGYEKPIEYAARKLDCSRQQVYNILEGIRKRHCIPTMFKSYPNVVPSLHLGDFGRICA